jgi:hypothetical protein
MEQNSRAVMTYTHEETVSLLNEKAKQGSGDKFVVKVNRRGGMSGLLEHIATLSEATVEHIANPEMWLPQLCGGGEFSLRVSHMDSPSAPVGGYLTFKFPGERFTSPRTQAVGTSTWAGPALLMFPARTPSGLPDGGPAQIPGVPAPPTFTSGYGMPQPQLGQQPQMTPQQPVFNYDPALEAKRELLARQERELVEAKSKAEREAALRESELKQKEREVVLRHDFDAKLKETKETSTKPAELLAAATPIVTALMTMMRQSRSDMLRMQEENARRSEENSRRNTEMMLQMQQQTQALMMKMMENKGPDPMVTAMLEIQKASSTGNAEMMTRMVDAMGTVSKTSIGMVEVLADIQLGGAPEHPMLAAVKEGVKAMAQLSKGAESGARSAAKQSAKQLPPPGQRQQAPAPAQSAPKGTNGAQAHQTPAQVFEAPNAPAPNMPPAFDGLPPAEHRRFQPVEGHVIEELKAMIQARHEPVEEIAQFFLDALQSTKELPAALGAHDGSIEALVAEHLGLWVMSAEENRTYIVKLGDAIAALAPPGMMADEGGEEREEESEEA